MCLSLSLSPSHTYIHTCCQKEVAETMALAKES
jgi:hypothetical protein